MRNHFHSTAVGLQVVHKSVHFLGGQYCKMVRSRDIRVCIHTAGLQRESSLCF